MPTITAAIIAKNEAQDIGECIESVLWMDDIVVLDSGSTDGTQDVVKGYAKVRLLETDWPGFGEQSNRALSAATSDWCFLIDADERVSPELCEEIKQAINGNSDIAAYRVPRLNFFYGRAMMHSLNPKGDRPIRLIKKGVGHFEEVVHQTAVIDGKVSALKTYLYHFPFRDLKEIIDKNNLYSTLGVEKLIDRGVKGGIIRTFHHALWAFAKSYFIKMGFLDGWPGFIIAFSCFDYTFYRYAKLMERSRKSK